MDHQALFWGAAAAMAAAAAAAVCAPLCPWLRRRAGEGGAGSAEAARALLADELAVLERERAAGLVSEAAYEACVEDVQRRALDEAAAQARAPRRQDGGWLLALAAALAVGASCGLYARLGSGDLISFFETQRTMGLLQQDGTLSANRQRQDMRLMRDYLKLHPENERAWVLYAKAWIERKNWVEAANAYRRAVDLKGRVAKDVSSLLEFAGCLMSLQTYKGYEDAADVLAGAISIDDGNLKLRELYAVACLETGRWGPAREQLERLMESLSPGDPAYQSLAQAAAYAAERERRAEAARGKP
ncbi:MAG: c-type cytochrome biogenesis protein CcmI [Duodenibacillus sp.]|nr:c-type cytochrome biogenesis protein CcmI [Duodenibacillus sp.]